MKDGFLAIIFSVDDLTFSARDFFSGRLQLHSLHHYFVNEHFSGDFVVDLLAFDTLMMRFDLEEDLFRLLS